MSNERFQSLLKTTPLPAHLRSMVSALGEGRTPSWWNAFTDAVSNAVGLFMGRKGQTYMDNVLTLYSHLERSSAAQTIAAQQEVYGKATVGKKNTFKRQTPGDAPAGQADRRRRRAGRARRSRKPRRHAFTSEGRQAALQGRLTHELIRQAESLWGGARNAFEKLADPHVKAGELYRKYRTNPGAGIDSAHIEEQLAKLRAAPQGRSNCRWPTCSTRARSTRPTSRCRSATRPTSTCAARETGSGRRVPRTPGCMRSSRSCSRIPSAIGRETIEHLRKAGELESRRFMESTLGQAIKEYRLEPKLAAIGKTQADAIDWLMRDRAAVDPANQTQEDKDFHAPLAAPPQTLANVPELKRIKGMFVPLRREGKWVLAGMN